MPTERTTELLRAFVREWAGVLASLTGGSPAVEDTAAGDGQSAEWRITATIDGVETGALTLALSHADAAEICRRVMGIDAPEADTIVDTLREFGGQAAGSLSQDSVARGLSLRVDVEGGDTPAPPGAQAFRVRLDDTLSLSAVAWGEVTPGAVAEAAPIPAPASASARGSSGSAPSTGVPANLDVILDIDLPVSVRFGLTEMTLHALSRLGPGSIVDLGRSPDDPVDVLVSGKVVARGEVVVVMGNYGVRITEVVSTADRIRSLGA